MKKTLFITTVLAICFSFFTVNAFADCDPGDSNCSGFASAMGIANDQFNQAFGNPNDPTDPNNGGYFAGNGNVCLNANGNELAKVVGDIESNGSGEFDPADNSAFSKSNMVLSGLSKFGETGNASLSASGEVEESSFVNHTDTNLYGNSGQRAGAQFAFATDIDSTETDQKKIEFTGELNACGTADLKIQNDPGHTRVAATEENQASGTYSTDPDEKSASALGMTGAGIMAGNNFGVTTVEGSTTGEITCDNAAWTKGSSIGDIQQTFDANSRTSTASIFAKQEVGGQN